ncbi:zinc finger protein 449-like [Microtus oregoni]|uniref:zinc finger protein 449-like n=1 Tax=Microtus oregoni TaxID=111838 RepID=UPI001BB16AD5|nr:zinc finger protein 449-like [Microtus oregoni]
MAAPRKSGMQVPSSCHQGPQPQERDTPWEAFHRRFSQFQYEEAAGPRDAFCRLWELCYQWLKPQTRSVEQILALLVTEKFLQILPADMESSASMRSLETRERLFTLIEELRRDNLEAENNINIGDMILEELVPMGPLVTPSNVYARPPAPQLMEPAQEFPEIPPAEPQEIIIDDDDDECPTFLEIEFPIANEYKTLEPPGEEPPEELLTVFSEPEEDQMSSENQNQWEMPGTSWQVRETHSIGVQTQAPPDEKPFSSEQLGLCSAHRQQHNSCLEICTGKIAEEGPGDRAGTSRGSDPSRHQLVSQEESTHDRAMPGTSSTQAATVSETEADDFDQERKQCRLCKREFMYNLGLVERGQTQAVLKHQCSVCGKGFKGKSRVTAHLVTHTHERPFSCQHCEKSYKHKSSLLRHIKIHRRGKEHKQSQGSQGPAHDAKQ